MRIGADASVQVVVADQVDARLNGFHVQLLVAFVRNPIGVTVVSNDEVEGPVGITVGFPQSLGRVDGIAMVQGIKHDLAPRTLVRRRSQRFLLVQNRGNHAGVVESKPGSTGQRILPCDHVFPVVPVSRRRQPRALAQLIAVAGNEKGPIVVGVVAEDVSTHEPDVGSARRFVTEQQQEKWLWKPVLTVVVLILKQLHPDHQQCAN